jgi:hypothetical protein
VYIEKCIPLESCLSFQSSDQNKTTCSPGYSGHGCLSCLNGFYRVNHKCRPCSTSSSIWILLSLFAFALVVLFWILSSSGANSLSAIKLIIFPFQVLSILSKLTGSWPHSLRWIFDIASFAGIDLDLLGTECTIPNYWSLWDLKIAFPIWIILCFALLFCFDRFLAWINFYIQLKSFRKVNWDRYILSLTNISNFIILPYLMLIFEPFICIKNLQGITFIASRPSIQCYSKEWKQRLPFGIIMIVIFGIIMPLTFAFSLRNIHESNFLHLRNRFGSLITNYKYEFIWWEIMF